MRVTPASRMALLLLSGILPPMTLAPGWLRTVSNINPVKHIVERPCGRCSTATS